jgi:hypothetical protein
VTLDLTTTDDELVVTAARWVLSVRRDAAEARLVADGTDWGRLSLLASVDRTGARDESYDVGAATVLEQGDERVVIAVEQASPAWDRKTTVVTCTPERVEVHVEVSGTGAIEEVALLGGRAVLDTGAAGTFRSQLLRVRSVFDPTPTQPVGVVRPGASAVTLGVVGDAEPARLNAVFSPPPLLVALGMADPTGPTSIPDGPWLALSAYDEVARLTFTQLRYEPVDGGFLLRFDYEAQTWVDGSWTSPRLAIAPTASPYDAVSDYRALLAERGLVRDPVSAHEDWWSRTIFCGWGAQCAEAARSGGSAAELARQDLYDGWLGVLAEHGVHAGTVVIDDQWSTAYGLGDVDTRKWPDLKGWIAERHAAGHRVLLWWRAWAPHGLPASECVLDAAGRPVAADPSNPAYLERLRGIVADLLGPDGLDADGFKIDFTQRAPSGSSLSAHGETWGIAMLHELLRTMYDAAKAAKPDALVITHTPHPSFGDVCDMVRLNDVLDSDVGGVPVPAVDQLLFRHAVVSRVMPDHLVDTDQWPMQTRADWLGYAEQQAGLGVPSLYYVERIDNSGEEISGADLEQVAAWWSR